MSPVAAHPRTLESSGRCKISFPVSFLLSKVKSNLIKNHVVKSMKGPHSLCVLCNVVLCQGKSWGTHRECEVLEPSPIEGRFTPESSHRVWKAHSCLPSIPILPQRIWEEREVCFHTPSNSSPSFLLWLPLLQIDDSLALYESFTLALESSPCQWEMMTLSQPTPLAIGKCAQGGADTHIHTHTHSHAPYSLLHAISEFWISIRGKVATAWTEKTTYTVVVWIRSPGDNNGKR